MKNADGSQWAKNGKNSGINNVYTSGCIDYLKRLKSMSFVDFSLWGKQCSFSKMHLFSDFGPLGGLALHLNVELRSVLNT